MQRFGSQDLMEFGSSDTNLYSYVVNDPLKHVDRLGLIRRCIEQIMLVTAYNDVGPGKNWGFYKRSNASPASVGPGTVAQANTSPPPYPMGCEVTVFGGGGANAGFNVAYSGNLHDTGAGWNADHQNVPPDAWIDIWLPGLEANAWGVQWRCVRICCDEDDACRN